MTPKKSSRCVKKRRRTDGSGGSPPRVPRAPAPSASGARRGAFWLLIRALPLAKVAASGRGGVIMSIWAFHYLTFAFRFLALIVMRHVAWAQSTFVLFTTYRIHTRFLAEVLVPPLSILSAQFGMQRLSRLRPCHFLLGCLDLFHTCDWRRFPRGSRQC